MSSGFLESILDFRSGIRIFLDLRPDPDGYTALRQIPSPKNKAKDCSPSPEYFLFLSRANRASTTVLRQINGESDAALRYSFFFATQLRFDKLKGESAI